MESTRNINKELRELRKEVMAWFKTNLPAKEFGAALMMAMVGLHMIEAGIRRTDSPEERRRLIHEFYNRKKTIERALFRPENRPMGGRGISAPRNNEPVPGMWR